MTTTQDAKSGLQISELAMKLMREFQDASEGPAIASEHGGDFEVYAAYVTLGVARDALIAYIGRLEAAQPEAPAAQPEAQKPDAWIWKYANGEEEVVFVDASKMEFDPETDDVPSKVVPLYAQPAAAPESAAQPEQNQCDGCLRGLPIRGCLHRADGEWPVGCSAPAAQPEARTDGLAVDRFAAAMKAKLAAARAKGRGGWDHPDTSLFLLSDLLRGHVAKGDPVNVANFAMMLHQRGSGITQPEAAAVPANWQHVANEWADMAINGLQWLRNIEDGTGGDGTAAVALQNMEDCLAHCRKVNDAMFAAAPTAPAVPAERPSEPRPYEPTQDMIHAAKRVDPAMTVEQVRAMWYAMWSAAPTASAVPPPLLTDAEILEIWIKSDTPSKENDCITGPIPFACAIETAVRKKCGVKS